jgi:starvation-inducible DNA-binding protein
MNPNIGITEKHLHKSTNILTALLADEMTLYIKTRKFHWNVSGDSFMELHVLFQNQYSQLESTIDLIAERINQLGSKTIGTLEEFKEHTRLKEKAGIYPNQKEMLKQLLNDHENIVLELRKDLDKLIELGKDIGTIDFLTGILEDHEKTAWILRRYLG